MNPPDLSRLLSFEHSDPHNVLGMHPYHGGVCVTVFLPDAHSVRVVPKNEAKIEPRWAEKVADAGAFIAYFPDATFFAYEVEYAIGNDKFCIEDPYRFMPTVGEMDIHLLAEGRHRRLYEKMGAHVCEVDGVKGVAFAVWAPSARRVSVVGDWNNWDGRRHMMRNIHGIWEIFLPKIGPGAIYKYEILPPHGGAPMLKLDPFAMQTELRPKTGGVIVDEAPFAWSDVAWIQKRVSSDPVREPWSIYEMHPGAWMRVPEEWGPGASELPSGHTGRWLTYREMAPKLVEYVKQMGFTHVEFMPLTEYPFDGSWGYQVTGYFAPTARYGTPEDLKFLINLLHENDIGVLLDWVPAHFPRDAHGLRRFDGTALYEHLDPRQGEHADWGTMVYNYGRNEVRNFLIASALFWMREYHFDGLRVDAVASMLYLDYSRKHGEWIPNRYGGRENLDAIAFIKELNEVVHGEFPGGVVVAEESTAWPAVSRPIYLGGLGFTFKWNMGWMHDTLVYFSKVPIHRRYHHDKLTFSFLYAWTENFMLPLSHDEVVHGKGSLLRKMPGDPWQAFANLRALYGYMWGHPGKKLLFMGGEFAQAAEFSENRSLDWHLLQFESHKGVQRLVSDLNRLYRTEPALWQMDIEHAGFQWIESSDSDNSVFAFLRWDREHKQSIIVLLNATPVPRYDYKIGVPIAGEYVEILNTDASEYSGSNVRCHSVQAYAGEFGYFPASLHVTLPPLGVVWLKGPPVPEATEPESPETTN